jgi:catechol 2,3-dioxygenase-like lactoylglutathione lyase family enzyme
MPIEHIGLGVPDVDAAKEYYDALMPLVGYQACFGNGYCPEDFQGTQLFLYVSTEAGDYTRHRVGLQHIAFLVPTRGDVHRVHEWAGDRGDEIVRAPKAFPQYGPHCYAVFFLDPHGFMVEVVTHDPQDSSE